MSSNNYLSIILSFIIFTLAQVLVFDHFILYNTAFCLFYVGFLLFYPFDVGQLFYILIGFVTGLVIDIFNDSLGVHAAACVALTFIRPYWLSINVPRGGYENINTPNIKTLGLQWFIGYAFPLIFFHHAILIFVEAGNFYYFFNKLLKILTSSLLTFVILAIYQYIFYRRVRLI